MCAAVRSSERSRYANERIKKKDQAPDGGVIAWQCSMSSIRIVLYLMCVLALAKAQPRSSDSTDFLKSLTGQFHVLIDRVNPAVVQIVAEGYAGEAATSAVRTQRGTGSGVIVDPAGFIVTNAHVVGSARKVQVALPVTSQDRPNRSILKPPGRMVPARVVGSDREADIAVLKVEASGLPHLRFGDSEQLRQGNLVFAFGSPFGLENSVTMGIVSSVARQVRADDPMIYIQTDATINPGNSGGPLVDTEGLLVGLNTFIVSQPFSGNGIGFAVPSNIAKTVYEQIREHGRVRRGQIGVLLQTITPTLAQALQLDKDWGVLISDVTPKSAAEAAGLQIKDIVVSMNGKPMENARQFGVNIYQQAGKTVDLEVLRGREKRKIQVAVLERPRDPDRMVSLIKGEENLVSKLGIIAIDMDENVSKLLQPLRRLSGVVVAGPIPESGDQDAVFLPGDVIYEVNNTPVPSLKELKALVEPMKSGQPVAALVERLGQLQFIAMVIE